MNILLVTTHLNAGGITSYTLSLAKALKKKGHQVFLASGGGQLENSTALTHFNIGIRTKCEIGFKVFRGAFRLKKIISEHHIDVVHAQTRVAAVASFWACRMAKKPYLTTAHGFFRPHWGRRLFPCWGKIVIAISSQVLEHLKKDFHISLNKIRLIYNGTDLARFEKSLSDDEKNRLLQQFKIESKDSLIGIVARLSPVKGHKFLLRAIDLLRREQQSVQCLVVGDGPSREEFLKERNRLGLEQVVRWVSWVDDPLSVVRVLDIFVLPSLQEGLSLSILEAQAAGIPVVASNVGGISEVVINGRTGLLVPPQNAEDLKEALSKLLKNKELARQMGREGKKRIEEKFNLDRMVDQVIKVYEEAVGNL